MMNMVLHELRSNRKSAIIWTCTLIALAVMYFAFFPSIAKDAEEFKKLLGAYPAPIRSMLGISLDNITTILGFYSMVFSFITLFGAIQAMNLGLSVLSREVRERTADFLLVKPVSRQSIVSAKLLASFTILLSTNAAYCLISFLFAYGVRLEDFDIKLFLLINLSLFLLQLIFLAIGIAVSVFFNKLRTVLPISLGAVFGFYMVGALLVTDEKDFARYLSPFKYFDVTNILKHSGFEVPYVITAAAVILVAVTVTYLIYGKKDIHGVS